MYQRKATEKENEPAVILEEDDLGDHRTSYLFDSATLIA